MKVSWTGDADIDLSIEEPGGTVCSHSQPRTTGGGTLLGDAFPIEGKATPDGLSESYICPEGFPGQYRVRIRKISGDVVAGRVTVDAYINYHSEGEKHQRQRIEVFDDEDALVVFELPNGRS